MKQYPLVYLRAMEPEDLELLYGIENDENVWSVSPTSVPYSRYALRDYMAHASNDIYVDRQVRLIIENEAHEAVGIADLADFDPKHLRAEIGLVIARDYQGRGYAHAVVERLIDYSRHILHLHQLYAVIGTNNETALKLFRKTGFQETATLQEWLFDGEKYHDSSVFQYFL